MTAYQPKLRAYTRRVLERRGVEVRTETAVERVTARGLHLKSGETLAAQTVVWGAGVRANPLADALGVEQTQGRRVVVDEHLHIPGRPEVFVVGDMAGATSPEGGLYPQVAQVAIQQGVHAARTIERELRGLAPEPFRYNDLGMMATIGRNAAIVAVSRRVHAEGVPGVARVGGAPRRQARRLPQSGRRAAQLDLQLLHLRPGAAPHPDDVPRDRRSRARPPRRARDGADDARAGRLARTESELTPPWSVSDGALWGRGGCRSFRPALPHSAPSASHG